MKKNLFIAFEGIDGSGKSTQVAFLRKRLEATGHKVYTTFEPTDSPIGSMIRSIFSHKMEADHAVIAGLFVADRLNHLLDTQNGILKKLKEGYTVITDRYYFSSYAYHSVHVPMKWVIEANAQSASILRPDINIYIDVSPEVSMDRISKNRENIELYETKENLVKVAAKYREAFELLKEEEKIVKINGEQPLETIAIAVWSALNDKKLV